MLHLDYADYGLPRFGLVLRANLKAVLILLVMFMWSAVYSQSHMSTARPVFKEGKATFFATTAMIESRTNRWKPCEEAFPVDLEEFGKKARQHLLLRNPKVPANVGMIGAEIRSYVVTSVVPKSEAEKTSLILSESWYVVFTFSRILPSGELLAREDCRVAMMLDGTFLQMVKEEPGR